MRTMLVDEKQEVDLQEGVQMRPARMADLETAVSLFNACAVDQIGVPEFKIDDIRIEWQTPNFDLSTSTQVVETAAGELAGYIEVWDTADLPVNVWVWGRVHPDHEGQGIGAALMIWAEERARQAIARVPDGVRVVMRCGCLSTHAPSQQLLQGYGMTLVRHFWRMVIDLEQSIPEPQWPDNIRLLTFAEHGDLPAVYRAVDDAFQDHWGHVDQPEDSALERWRHWLENDKVFDPTLWFLAMDGDDVAGISLCRAKARDDPDMGYVNMLGVRRAWRRQGLALALLHHSFREFQERGQARVGLGVDAASLTGATRLYEKAGMHVARQFDAYEKVLRPGKDITTQTVDP